MNQSNHYPTDFTWGVATSAFQIEGGASADGKGPSIWDTFCLNPNNIKDKSDGTVACDHYNRYREDVGLISSLGVDAYRFSMAWARVQPSGKGAWNEAGFGFYDRLLDELAAKEIKAHLTLYHWDLPQGLQDDGGWLNRDTAHRFADYAHEVARRFGNRIAAIATHNEPWCSANLGYGNAQFAPGVADAKQAIQVSHHLLLSHGLAMTSMRAAASSAQLGIVLNQWTADPATDSEADRAMAELEYARSVQWFMDPIFKGRYPELALRAHGENAPVVHDGDLAAIAQPIDFLGVNYYFRSFCSAETPPRTPPGKLGFTDMGWEIYPQGLTELLVKLNAEYMLPPVYITENGMANPDSVSDGKVADPERIAYVQMHLDSLKAAMEQGVDVRGYFLWSLLDNFEWNSGYAKRFGIVHVDYETQERTLKDSAIWYRDFLSAQRQR
ncbi:GH1 family beta-glucosidase [Massilia antarctica]|uniref:GH1 family beta-glucosidase n=1 Tax=Massilia antarctica TaxID=2765360 RepID=UPI0006BB8826|nr:GH1 family beta-glucosidase [Massilia sp. H27-R4]MCY0912908.1 GH1 family beta-glucosidase [Massilia sp. H27-R4]CUI07484.1 Beta-glucosidase [Janthinobacterium sp. CG23_2]CUU31270.1 Beta-glucosidase [Janthinobacterium sp. CG23_2]